MKEKLDHALEEAYHTFKRGDKDKLREWTKEVIMLEERCSAFDKLVPLVKSVQKNVKTIIKEDEVPEELSSAVASIVYFTCFYGMPSFQRFTAQIAFKFGDKYVDRIQQKHKGVDDGIYQSLNYKPSKDEVKDRSKDLSSLSKKREKEEKQLLKDSGSALVSTITDIPSAIANMSAKKPAKKAKSSRRSSKVMDESDSDSDSDEEEEYSNSSDSEATDSDQESGSDSGSESESESESEDEKKKKEKKQAKKDKKQAKKDKKQHSDVTKVKKVKPMNETDSEMPPEQESDNSSETPKEAQPEVAKEAQPEVAKEEQPEVAKEENVYLCFIQTQHILLINKSAC